MAATADPPFWRPPPATRRELRKFGWLFAALGIGLAGWMAWRGAPAAAAVPAAVAALLFAVSWAAPRALLPLWWPWMVLVNVLGFVNSHLLLGLVFYLLFTPIGWAMRILGRDPLGGRDFAAARRVVAAGGSLWHRREVPQLDGEHFEHQF